MPPIIFRQGSGRVVSSVLRFATGTLTQSAGEAVYTPPGGGGGGGPWGSTGITGTANRFAIFDGTGSPAFLAYPSTGIVSWSGSAWAATTIDAPLGLSGGHLSIAQADATHNGYLSSTDWNVFSGKQAGSSELTALAALGDGLPYRSGTWAAYSLGDLAMSGGAVQVTQARGLRESGGTTMTMGAVAAGELLIRSGATIIGAAIGSVVQAYSDLLKAIATLGGSGLIVKTGASSAVARMITSSNGITTTNGDGVAGNPLVTLATCTVNTDVDATSYHWWRIQTEGALVVGSGVTGFSAPSGTVTLAAVASGYIGIAATITNNLSFYTVRSNSALYQTGFGGTNGSTTKLHYVSPTSTASHRVWFALSTNLGTGSNPAANSCGIVYDPARSANWLVFSYDGTMQTSDTGVVYSVSTHYYLKLRTTSTGVYGVVSTTASGLNGAETSVTSHLISSTASQYILFLAVRTAAGALSPVTFCGMDYTASYQ